MRTFGVAPADVPGVPAAAERDVLTALSALPAKQNFCALRNFLKL
jgi:hypothetical protein